MNRVKVGWSGLSGLPGLSTFYVGTGITDMTPIRNFFDAWKTFVPTALQWQIANSGDQIQEATGVIVGSWSGPAQATVIGAGGAGGYAAPVGAEVRWDTSAIIDGRRIRGRTFMVPILGALYDSSGTIATATLTSMQTAASALVTALAGEMKVWHRKNAKGPGANATVTSALVPDKAYVLRRRRD